MASTDKITQNKARKILACLGPPVNLDWADRLSVYVTGARFLIPQYTTQILFYGFGGAFGGVLSLVPLIPLGFGLGFMYATEGDTLLVAVTFLLLVLGPCLGIAGLLMGLGLGVGIVLGRGRSYNIEAVNAAMGGFLSGALLAGYLYLIDVFGLSLSPIVIMAAFALVGALIAGPMVYFVRQIKRLLKRGQMVGQIIAGAITGAAIGILADVILHSFPSTLITGACLTAGITAGLAVVERRYALRSSDKRRLLTDLV